MSYWALELRKPSDFRSLEGLADVRSNGRVLNLGAITRDLAQANPVGRVPAFFASSTLNQSIIVKHNIRDNERHLFARAQPVATKLILPIDPENLALGGVTFMLGERQASRILRDKLGLSRATGDARFPVQIAVCSQWLLSVPLCWFFGITLGWGLTGIWVAMMIEEWLRGLLMYRRWKRRDWLKFAHRSRDQVSANTLPLIPEG